MWFEDQLSHNQQFVYSNVFYTNQVSKYYSFNTIPVHPYYTYSTNDYNPTYVQEIRHITQRPKQILTIIDPKTNMIVNPFQNDVDVQTDEYNRTTTRDRTDVKINYKRYDQETQTNDPPLKTTLSTQTFRVTTSRYIQTVGLAQASNTSSGAKEESLLKHHKFQGM